MYYHNGDSVDCAILKALRSDYHGRRNIEDRIDIQGKLLAGLISHLLESGTLTPEDLNRVIPFEMDFDAYQLQKCEE